MAWQELEDLTFVLAHLGPPRGTERHWNRCHTTRAKAGAGGGRNSRPASILRFCTMAARWNSSRAPERPRSRRRSKVWWVFRCAKRISTRLRWSRDLRNALVFILRGATSRASSCKSRGILRASCPVAHRHVSRWSLEGHWCERIRGGWPTGKAGALSQAEPYYSELVRRQ